MKKITPIKAIRAKCLECSVGQMSEVRNCLIPTCPLYPYRMGHRPKADEKENNADNNDIFEDNILDEQINDDNYEE